MATSQTPIKVFCRGCGEKLDVSLLEPFSRVPCPNCGLSIRVPRRFDRYLLEKVCGIGGMSKVYRAIDPELARRVAVKILNREFAEECRGCDQFIHEAKLVARINHPGVIPIYDCGIFEEEPFLVMRYMERGSLEAMQKAGQLPELPELCRWLHTIAEGLHAALQYQVVHHDIKPGNILISADGTAGLGDFDLADIREAPESLLTATGWASPAYVSPERLYEGHEDWQGDVFSFGVSAYELFTGQLPFGHSGETEELLERRRHPVYLPAIDLNPAVGQELSDLLNRMMTFEPLRRPDYPEIIAVFHRATHPRKPGFADKLKTFFHKKS